MNRARYSLPSVDVCVYTVCGVCLLAGSRSGICASHGKSVWVCSEALVTPAPEEKAGVTNGLLKYITFLNIM